MTRHQRCFNHLLNNLLLFFAIEVLIKEPEKPESFVILLSEKSIFYFPSLSATVKFRLFERIKTI